MQIRHLENIKWQRLQGTSCKRVVKIYDPLGLVSPITLGKKLLYSEACNEKSKNTYGILPYLIIW